MIILALGVGEQLFAGRRREAMAQGVEYSRSSGLSVSTLVWSQWAQV